MASRSHSGDGASPLSRKPQQERSLVRYGLLLDAAHALLLEHELADVGLYQVAERAGVPAASAYHFFPSVGTVFVALSERYQAHLALLMEGALPPADGMWQTLLKERATMVVLAYNHNLAMSKIVLGGGHPDLVHRDEGFIETMSVRLTSLCDELFYMPVVRNLQHRLHVMLTLLNSIWSLSFAKHGVITPEFETEATVAAIAYCRTFLPEFLEPRTRDL